MLYIPVVLFFFIKSGVLEVQGIVVSKLLSKVSGCSSSRLFSPMELHSEMSISCKLIFIYFYWIEGKTDIWFISVITPHLLNGCTIYKLEYLDHISKQKFHCSFISILLWKCWYKVLYITVYKLLLLLLLTSVMLGIFSDDCLVFCFLGVEVVNLFSGLFLFDFETWMKSHYLIK